MGLPAISWCFQGAFVPVEVITMAHWTWLCSVELCEGSGVDPAPLAPPVPPCRR